MEFETVVACLLLGLGSLVYIFWNQKDLRRPATKTRVDYLHERRDVVYDNLRDLNFEYRAGKYPGEDYDTQRDALEAEAATIVTEIDHLERLPGKRSAGL